MTIQVPAPCPACQVGKRGACPGCVECQWTGEADWYSPARATERTWLDRNFPDDGPEIGDNPPGNLVAPGQWNGHGRMVGASGAIENGRGVCREFTALVELEPARIRELVEGEGK